MTARDREILRRAGYRATAARAVELDGTAAALFTEWRRGVERLLRPLADEYLILPACVSPVILSRSQYAALFPQHVLLVSGRKKRVRYALAPATCLAVYNRLRGRRLPRRLHRVLVFGACARAEDGALEFPHRLPFFHMIELVLVGPGDAPRRLVMSVAYKVTRYFHARGLRGSWQAATDPFFGGGGRGRALLQRLRGEKQEYVLPVGGRPLAVASVNVHGDAFARRFRFGAKGGGTVTSACVAFGLERLVLATLLSRRRGSRQRIRSHDVL